MALVLALIPLVLIIICFTKESAVTGLYKTFGVYGRFYAYLTTCFLAGGICTLVGGIASLFIDLEELQGIGSFLYLVVQAVLLFGIGLFMYSRAKKKCPDFLRKKLLVSMLITGFGVGAKICLFFLGFVWKLTAPKKVTLGNGQSGYVYCGDVYTSDGTCVGSVSGPDSFTPNSNYIKDTY